MLLNYVPIPFKFVKRTTTCLEEKIRKKKMNAKDCKFCKTQTLSLDYPKKARVKRVNCLPAQNFLLYCITNNQAV